MQFGHDAMPFGRSTQVLGVHLGDHERDVGVHAERGRVVDDPRARGRRDRRPLERERVVDVDDHEVEPVEAARRAAPRTSTSPPANGSLRPSDRGDA